MITLALLAAAATVTSAAPDRIALTVYRAPYRGRGDRMQLSYLGGFALVTETRRIAVPAGEAVLRFEGVADGIVPVSAVIGGLPGGTIEKNRDARVLSPAALVDGTLGRQVTLHRTDRASGRVTEEQATIVAGPADGVVVRTAHGIEALGCAGLGDSLRYRRVPADLSARPTLSVTTRSPRARTVTVTLSYLASGFDWSASYVATLAPDGRRFDLFAWLTLANGNAQGFPAAQVQAVAGRLERRYVQPVAAAATRLSLGCYPLGTTTSDLPAPEDIVVTGSRLMRDAVPAPMMVSAPPAPPPPPPPPPEDLGDLKLYRVPMRVTVAANAQKQVALIVQRGVAFERVYRVALPSRQAVTAEPTSVVLRLRNDADAGLGIPLPAGTTALYTRRAGTPLLVGEGTIGDTATAERVDLAAGTSHQVTASQVAAGNKRMQVTLANASPFAVTVEVPIGWAGEATLDAPTEPLPRIDGVQTWRTTLPANATRQISYGYR